MSFVTRVSNKLVDITFDRMDFYKDEQHEMATESDFPVQLKGADYAIKKCIHNLKLLRGAENVRELELGKTSKIEVVPEVPVLLKVSL